MALGIKARHLPERVVTGAFILNSGLDKRKADEAAAQRLHGFASGTYPFLGKLDPKLFVQGLSTTEIALGAALLVPVIPVSLVGAGLTAFSAGLLGLYVRTPGMREGFKPTEQGLPISKDVWMLGIGLSLFVDGRVEKRAKRKAKAKAAEAAGD